MNSSKIKYLAKSANKKVVLIGKEFQIKTHHIRDAVKQIEISDKKERYEVDLGHKVGLERCIKTNNGYEKVIEDTKKRIIVCDEKPVPTTVVTVVLVRKGENYLVVDAHPGILTPPLPWSNSAKHNVNVRKKSEEFWSCHAFALDE